MKTGFRGKKLLIHDAFEVISKYILEDSQLTGKNK